MSAAPNPPPPRMVGDLPLVESARFDALGQQYWRERGISGWNIGGGLVFLQHHLFDQLDADGVDLDSACQFRYRSLVRYTRQIGYHPDILPHWERYAEAKGREGGMELFRIRDIALPTAPFFSDKLVPVLKNSNDTLAHLELSKCSLESDGLACVAAFLTDNASVATLDLSRNKIDNADNAKYLALAIWNHPELRCVNFTECGLGTNKGVLAELLSGLGNLEALVLDFNAICSEGMALVAEFLATDTAIETLSLDGNSVDMYVTWGLYSQAERLRVKENKVDNASVLSKALKKNTSLRQLCLRDCDGVNLPTFFESKRAMELLTCLDLSRNNIGKEGAEMVADFLGRNPVLIELDVSICGIGSRSAKLFAKALKANDTLEHLNLRYNGFNDKSVPFFADVLRNNTTLLSLNLASNNIKQKTGRKEMLKSVCDTSSLETVLSSNHTCMLRLTASKGEGTPETVLRNINGLEDEGEKIRYKVVLALFAMDSDLFSPRTFDDVPLELMPRLLHLVQQEIGYGGFGDGVVETTRKRRRFDPTLRRVHDVLSGWNQLPLLFVRGPGKLKEKRKRKRHVMSFKEDEDEEWTPRSR